MGDGSQRRMWGPGLDEGMVRNRQVYSLIDLGLGGMLGQGSAARHAGSHPLFSSFCFPAPHLRCGRRARGIPALWPHEVFLHLSFLSPPFLAFLALCYLVTQDQEEEVRGYIERLHRGWSAGRSPSHLEGPCGSLAKA